MVEKKKKYIQHSVQNFKKEIQNSKFPQKLGPLEMPLMFNIMANMKGVAVWEEAVNQCAAAYGFLSGNHQFN